MPLDVVVGFGGMSPSAYDGNLSANSVTPLKKRSLLIFVVEVVVVVVIMCTQKRKAAKRGFGH